MPPSAPSSESSTSPASVWRPFGVPKRVVAAVITAVLAASSLFVVELDASAEESQPAPLGAQIIAAAATAEVAPLPPLPPGARPFAPAGGPRFDGRTPARPTPEPPEPVEPPAPAPERSVWDRLADCESGDWDRNGDPIPGTARWDLRPGAHIFEGGLQFHPDTWDGFAPGVLGGAPAAAYEASRAQQIAVAEAVLDAQGWGAWPACARKLGLLG